MSLPMRDILSIMGDSSAYCKALETKNKKQCRATNALGGAVGRGAAGLGEVWRDWVGWGEARRGEVG